MTKQESVIKRPKQGFPQEEKEKGIIHKKKFNQTTHKSLSGKYKKQKL